jgi:hypothetical protein
VQGNPHEKSCRRLKNDLRRMTVKTAKAARHAAMKEDQ